MKILDKIIKGILAVIILILAYLLFTGNETVPTQTNQTEPDGYTGILYYNKETGKMFARGYSEDFTYGLDSAVYELDVQNGENSLYFVLNDMSIEFEIIKYE